MTVSRQRVTSSRAGVVAAPDARVAEAGAAMLRLGGNAIDAAVAAAFAIGVVEPHMSGLGGGTWMVAALRDTENYVVVEGPMVTPMAAYPGMFEMVTPQRPTGLYAWPAVKEDANLIGPLSTTVPGTVAALCTASNRLGRLPLRELLAPAISLASNGTDVNWFTSAAIVQEARVLARDQGCRELFMPAGFPLRPPGFAPADRLQQPALALTLNAIAEQGADAFYRGPIGTRLVDFVQAAGGILSLDDLKRYSARIHKTPLARNIGAAKIVGTERTGTPTVMEAVNLFNVASRHFASDEDVPVAWAKALRLAHLDRMRWMSADPSVSVPWPALLSTEYATALWQSHTDGLPRPDAAIIQPRPAAMHEAELSEPTRWGCTSHISVVDRAGNFVALTQTILDNFGARIMEPETGVLLNDGMAYFDPRPGYRNGIKPGIVGMAAVSPVILEVAGRGPIAAFGGAGGRKIISSTAQLVPHIVRGATAQEAIDEPRVHADAEEATVDVRWPSSVAERLVEAGFRTTIVAEEPTTWHFARMGAVSIDARGMRHGGVDSHKPGAVAFE